MAMLGGYRVQRIDVVSAIGSFTYRKRLSIGDGQRFREALFHYLGVRVAHQHWSDGKKLSLVDTVRTGLPETITEDDARLPWGGKNKLPVCGLCRRRFVVGQVARFVFHKEVTSRGGPERWPNFFVCQKCDQHFERALQARVAKESLRRILKG